MQKARVALMGGMGYPATETLAGMPRLKARLEEIGVEVLLVGWAARQEVYNFMHGYGHWRGYAGDSLGAGSAGQYPGDIKEGINYAAGFQPSVYDARSHGGLQTIAANITRAHCIYDPSWIETFGLGNAQWIKSPGSATKLLVTQAHGCHPDDWGYSQDLIFNEIKGLIPS